MLDRAFHERVATCARCGSREGKTCTRDGRTIFEHARGGDCPERRYANPERVVMPDGTATPTPPGGPLLGDRLERVLRRLKLDRAAAAFERLTGLPCGCRWRKKALNWLDAQGRKLLKRGRS